MSVVKQSIRAVRIGPWSVRYCRFALIVGGVIALVLVILGIASLMFGDYVLTPEEVLAAFTRSDTGLVSTIVMEWRLPRTVAALVFGGALGVSGAIFQTMTRNPLASPDVIGMTSGSYLGALLVLAYGSGGALMVAGGSTAGGLVAAAVIYALAYRGGIQGFRLIIVGVAISSMLGSMSTYLVLRASLQTAMAATIWGAGTLVDIPQTSLLLGTSIIGLASVAVAILASGLRQLELGDAAASASGVSVERTRMLAITAAVTLTAIVTAFAGLIPFIALAAPQIARRMLRTSGITLLGAALVGAVLLLGSDIVAQHVGAAPLPVGTVTVIFGGGYLVWLLIQEARTAQ